LGLFSRKKTETTPVIDLREPVPSKPKWGSPVPCPACRGRGYLDRIDPHREVMFLHCIECFTKYEVARADTEPATATEAFTL
jgi:hypothetical protein